MIPVVASPRRTVKFSAPVPILEETVREQSSQTTDYAQFIQTVLNSQGSRMMFEKSELPFSKTIFINNGLPSLLLIHGHKGTAKTLSISRFSDTYAKLKIFVSKNFSDLKRAFLFYECKDKRQYYETYNEFIEHIYDSQQYRTGLKDTRFVSLFESPDETFEVRRFRFSTVSSANSTTVFSQAFYYHKLSFYRHFKRISVNKETEAESQCLRRLKASSPADFEYYLGHRIHLLVQTALGREVVDFELSLLTDNEKWEILSVDRIQTSKTAFSNFEDDEDDFEAFQMPSIDLSARSKLNRAKLRQAATDDNEAAIGEISPEMEEMFRPVRQKLERHTATLLATVNADFEKTLANKLESDVCFGRLFPDSKFPLSTLLKYEESHGLLSEYVKQQRKAQIGTK